MAGTSIVTRWTSPADEVNSSSLDIKVLIATQGSEFKNAVVSGLVARLKQMPTYIKVIDVSSLPQANEAECRAIVLIHTWESWEPEAHSRLFVEQSRDLNKLIVLTTSGSGRSKIGGVNAITSASGMSDVPSHIADIETRINTILISDVEKQKAR